MIRDGIDYYFNQLVLFETVPSQTWTLGLFAFLALLILIWKRFRFTKGNNRNGAKLLKTIWVESAASLKRDLLKQTPQGIRVFVILGRRLCCSVAAAAKSFSRFFVPFFFKSSPFRTQRLFPDLDAFGRRRSHSSFYFERHPSRRRRQNRDSRIQVSTDAFTFTATTLGPFFIFPGPLGLSQNSFLWCKNLQSALLWNMLCNVL